MDPEPHAVKAPELRRSLGPTSAVMITVGSVIGSGIFFKPLDISQALPSPIWIYGCWVGLGLVCLCGAFAYGELGTMIPEAGGMYAYLRDGWGRLPAFLYGWCLLLVINTGAIAALAVVFSTSLATLIHMSDAARTAVAAGMIIVLATVNHFGVRWGAFLQNISTFTKLASLAVIVLAVFLFGRSFDVPPAAEAASVASPGLIPGIVAACVALFWAYEGWHQLPFSAAELENPHRDLPRGLILGVLILIVTYLAVNAAYLHVVPQQEMRSLATEIEVPQLALTRVFGPGAGAWLTVMICISVFGAANPNLLSAPRALYAMARDGLMFKALTTVHSVHHTPTIAIWVQAIWAIVLVVVLETFRDLTEYVVFASILFYAMGVGAVYSLRRRQPDKARPYRCTGYPFTPAVFILVALFVDVYTLLDPAARGNAVIGLGILALGVPVYFLMDRRGARQAPSRP